MKKIIILIGLLMTFSASAVDCDYIVKNQTGAVKDQMLVACLKASSEADSIEKVLNDPDKVADIAKTYSSAIGIMAKEVGMAVNEFIKTDAGMIATVAVIYTVFGDDLRRMIFGIPIVLVIMFMWRKFVDTMIPKKEIKDKDGKITYTAVRFYDYSEGEATWYVVSSIAAGVTIVFVLVIAFL